MSSIATEKKFYDNQIDSRFTRTVRYGKHSANVRSPRRMKKRRCIKMRRLFTSVAVATVLLMSTMAFGETQSVNNEEELPTQGISSLTVINELLRRMLLIFLMLPP